ncbi:MAG: hypothetical protein ABGU93_00845 [Acetobacterium sp.]|uniref:hypothetical protein n=1 Tax=Acetobacterium sp. TaxID=1872094 RepID=UPI003242F60B
MVRSTTAANIIAEGRNSLHQTGLILVLLGITIAAVTAFFVRRYIIDPLNHLKIGLDSLRFRGGIPGIRMSRLWLHGRMKSASYTRNLFM